MEDPNNLQPDIQLESEAHNNLNRKLSTVSIEDIRARYLNLDNEQRLVVDTATNYAQSIRKSKNGLSKPDKAPLVIIQGGAGVGKSTVIEIISQATDIILKEAGDDFAYPYVVRVAPTGVAAANISGATLHSMFSINFGDGYESLSDKTRDKKRHQFQNTKMLIFDEISMIDADNLYKISQRMKEITMKYNEPFGGLCVLMFGDLLQLRPVRSRYIFECPRYAKFQLAYSITNMWESFTTMTLCTNHRQGEDHVYASLLNRVRIGDIQTTDLGILNSKVIKREYSNIPQDALFVTSKNKFVNEFNDMRLDQLEGEQKTTVAVVKIMGKTAMNVRKVKGTGNIVNTPLQEILRIKLDAKVMLTHNLDVSDGLTNGAFGTIFEIEENSEGEVSTILVEFIDPLCGADMRLKTGYNRKYPDKNVTPIKKVELPYRGNSKVATGTVVQFPLRLAFGSTCHKIQGLTVRKPKKVVVDLDSAFGAAQAYVMLSRVQDISQISIFGEFDKSKIYHCSTALKETYRIKDSSQETFVQNKTGNIILSSVNIRSLNRNYDLLQKQQKNLSEEVIFLQETWISNEDSNINDFRLPGMKFCHNSIGNGKGVAAFLKEEYIISKNINDHLYQISVYKSSKATIINVYKSNGCDETKFMTELSNIIECEEINAEVFICGDFNFCFLNESTNKIKLCLEKYNFEQIVKKSTHKAGHLLDQVYVKNAKNSYIVIHQSLFLLDHDIIHVVKL